MKIHSFTLAIAALTTTLSFANPEDAPKPPAAKEPAAEAQKHTTEAKPKSDDAAPGSKREKAMLKKFDANGDGVLSDEEKATAKAKTEERQAKFLKKNDTNGDGVLSEEERAAAGLSGKKAAKGE